MSEGKLVTHRFDVLSLKCCCWVEVAAAADALDCDDDNGDIGEDNG